MSRSVAVLIASIAGITMVLSKFLVPLGDAEVKVADWFNVLAAIAFVLGGANLLKMNLLAISARGPGWGYSAVTLVAFLVTLGVGVLKAGVPPAAAFPDVPFSGEKDVAGSALWWLYEYAMSPITGTLFAMLAFYVASAAFRAFRAKNLAAILLLSAAFLVLLGRTAAAGFLTGWFPEPLEALKLDNLVDTMLVYVGTPGSRAIVIGIALGVAATSLRVLLGLERPYLGGGGGNG